MSILNLAGGALTTSASRTASSAPVANPLNLTADSAITTSSTAATVDLNLSSSTIGGSAGTLTFRNDAASGTGVFQPRFSGGFTFGRPIVIANGGFGTTVLQSYNTSGNDQTFNGVLSGSGSYIRTATTGGTGGNTIFTAANTYSGGTTLNDGGLGLGIDSVGSPVTSGPIGTGTLTIGATSGKVFSSGGTHAVGNPIVFNSSPLVIGGANDLTLAGTISLGSSTRTIQIDNTGASMLSGIISGSGGGLTKTGAGTLTLSGANTYSGGTTISAGTIKLGAANAIPGNTFAGDVSVTGTLDLNTYSEALNGLNGAGTIDTVAGGSPTLTVGANGNGGTFSGVIQNTLGTLSLIKSGAGTEILSSGNTYSGGTSVSGGTLQDNSSGNSSAAFGAGTVTLSNGGRVRFNSTSSTTFDNAVALGSGGGTVTFHGNGTFSPSAISGSGALICNVDNGITFTINDFKGWSGSVSATSTGAGGFLRMNSFVNNSMLNVALDLGAGMTLSRNAGTSSTITTDIGTLSSASATSSIGASSSGSGTFVFSVGSRNEDSVFAGTVVDGSTKTALTKVGTGKMTLSGANTYSGNTTVSGGTLLVNNASGSGTGSGTVAVNSGGTLGGNGSLSGAVTVGSGSSGALSPGSAGVGTIGTLTLGSSLTLGASSIASLELNKAAGPVYTADKAAVTGAITYGGTLNVTVTGSALAANDTFTLFTGSGFSGSFSSVNLPALASGISWDTNNLATTGVLDIYTFTTNSVQSMTAAKNTAANLLIAKLLAKATSARGTVGLASVSASSAQGGTVVINGSNLTYTPASNFTGSDSFTCRLNDGHGAITATVLVTVIDPGNPGTSGNGSNLQIRDLGGNQVRLIISGTDGVTYQVQTNGSLSSTGWVNLGGSFVMPSVGLVNVTNAVSPGALYFRTVLP